MVFQSTFRLLGMKTKTALRLESAKLRMCIKAIILDQPEHFHLTDVGLPPQPDQDEVLMHILRVWIYGTDLHTFEGKLYGY